MTMHKKVIHDTVAQLLGLPLNRVINAYTDGQRPSDMHATLRYFGQRREILPETRLLDSDGNAEIRTIWNTILEVQLYTKDRNAVDELRTMVEKLELYSIDSTLKANDVVIVDIGPVRDISALLHERIWESRAVVEINLRFTDVLADKLDMIDGVQVVGTTDNVEVDTGLIRKDDSING